MPCSFWGVSQCYWGSAAHIGRLCSVGIYNLLKHYNVLQNWISARHIFCVSITSCPNSNFPHYVITQTANSQWNRCQISFAKSMLHFPTFLVHFSNPTYLELGTEHRGSGDNLLLPNLLLCSHTVLIHACVHAPLQGLLVCFRWLLQIYYALFIISACKRVQLRASGIIFCENL